MVADVYQRLARHLDSLPGGYPPTESGVELRLLRRLFTEEEAELALQLTLLAETAAVVARRAGIPVAEAGERLAEMEKKGLISGSHKEGYPPRYSAALFVIGIWEHQVNRLELGLIEEFEEYLPALIDAVWTVPQLRTIPVGESISAQQVVMQYERAGELVRGADRFAVAPCICRREHSMVGEGCDRPEESCLVMGSAADYYVRNGLGRSIDQDEALGLLVQAEATGLVLQPGNSQEPLNICMCCGCCCRVLLSLKKQPRPVDMVASAFIAAIDAGTCSGCGTCVDRCQMDALWLDGGKATLDLERCIGCGLCVTTCPTESLSLLRKPEPE
jgi:electron transport complex protein RnfB